MPNYGFAELLMLLMCVGFVVGFAALVAWFVVRFQRGSKP